MKSILKTSLLSCGMMLGLSLGYAQEWDSFSEQPVTLSAELLRVGLPKFDHIIVVIEENHSYDDVVGIADLPYMNELISQGALFTNSYSVVKTGSQPNYLALFSGSTQNASDAVVGNFDVPCLGSELIQAGYTFMGYAEGLPSVGFNGVSSGYYVRRHNPWVQFTTVSKSLNVPFTEFPTTAEGFSKLPTIAFVVPDVLHNGESDTTSRSLPDADAWLRANLSAYAEWAKSNNSLLIVTFDEKNHYAGSTNIPTFFVGAHVKPGKYSEKINHYSVLRTLEDIYGLSHLGASASVSPITDVWE